MERGQLLAIGAVALLLIFGGLKLSGAIYGIGAIDGSDYVKIQSTNLTPGQAIQFSFTSGNSFDAIKPAVTGPYDKQTGFYSPGPVGSASWKFSQENNVNLSDLHILIDGAEIIPIQTMNLSCPGDYCDYRIQKDTGLTSPLIDKTLFLKPNVEYLTYQIPQNLSAGTHNLMISWSGSNLFAFVGSNDPNAYNTGQCAPAPACYLSKQDYFVKQSFTVQGGQGTPTNTSNPVIPTLPSGSGTDYISLIIGAGIILIGAAAIFGGRK
jgi:hypothetical protein